MTVESCFKCEFIKLILVFDVHAFRVSDTAHYKTQSKYPSNISKQYWDINGSDGRSEINKKSKNNLNLTQMAPKITICIRVVYRAGLFGLSLGLTLIKTSVLFRAEYNACK